MADTKDLNVQLFEAIKQDNIDKVFDLIAAGADVNAKNENEETPLHFAKEPQIVRRLIEANADVNAADKGGYRPIHSAFEAEVAQLLLEAGADVNATTTVCQYTPLHRVTNPDVLKLMIDAGANVNAQDVHGNTPLHNVRHLKGMQHLVEAGADVNLKDEYGRIPLHNKMDEEGITYLVKQGADVNATDNSGQTPLHALLRKDCLDLDTVSFRHITASHVQSFVLTNSQHNYSPAVRALVENGADVNVVDKNGNTPMHYVSDGQTATFLMNVGADPYIMNKNGETPADMIFDRQERLVRMMFKDRSLHTQNALKDLYDKFGNVREVIQNGGDLNEKSSINETLRQVSTQYKESDLQESQVMNLNYKDEMSK